MKIYTKTGDQGYTDLIGGRVKKNDVRVLAIGSIDHAIAEIGVLHAFLDEEEMLLELEWVMRVLFDINSEIASTNGKTYFSYDTLDKIEQMIDHYDSLLPPLKHFILPGGSKAAAFAHKCRTELRYVEREIITLSEHFPQDEVIHKTLNRISDYFFVFARYLNFVHGYEDIKK